MAPKLCSPSRGIYAIGERELVMSFMTDLAETSDAVADLAGLAELAAHHGDARP